MIFDTKEEALRYVRENYLNVSIVDARAYLIQFKDTGLNVLASLKKVSRSSESTQWRLEDEGK